MLSANYMFPARPGEVLVDHETPILQHNFQEVAGRQNISVLLDIFHF